MYVLRLKFSWRLRQQVILLLLSLHDCRRRWFNLHVREVDDLLWLAIFQYLDFIWTQIRKVLPTLIRDNRLYVNEIRCDLHDVNIGELTRRRRRLLISLL